MDNTTPVTSDLPAFGMVPNWVWQHPDCTPVAVMVWLALWRFVSYGSFTSTGEAVAWPSYTTLADMLNMHERTVIRHVQVLESIGAVTVEGRTDERGGDSSNRYHLHFVNQKGGVGDSPVTGATDTPVMGGSDSSVTQTISIKNDIHSERDPLVAATASPRPRDPIWDTLVEICGAPPPDQKGNYGKTVSWLKQQGATPETMRQRAGRIAEEFRGGQYVTAASLRKHWTRYDALVGQMNSAQMDSTLEERRRQQSTTNLLDKIAQKASSGVSEETMLGDGR